MPTQEERTARRRVLIPFPTPHLYGMERAVIEIFDALRPEVEPYFVQGSLIYKAALPVIREMCRRGLTISLLPDKEHWPQVGRPRSIRQLVDILKAAVRSNLAILKEARHKDVLYVPGISYAHTAVLAALMFRLRGRKVIHHFHDLGTRTPTLPLWMLLVTDIVHNTEFGYEVISSAFPGIRRKRNFILPYILDLEPHSSEDPEMRRAFEGKRNLFFVGQISPHKGIDILLEAFSSIASAYPDAMLHLVGGCPESFRGEFDELCSQPFLVGRVKYWGFREDVLNLLSSAYLYVHASPPSRFQESFCRSVVEAMSLGAPTVCFRSGALQEVVINEETGLVCEEKASSLAAALMRFLDDPGFRDRCAANGKQRYQQLYSAWNVQQRWREFLLGPLATEHFANPQLRSA